MNEKSRHACTPASRAAQLFWGAGLMMLGAALMLKTLGFWDFHWREMGRLWPLVLVAIGLTVFVGPPKKDGRRGGLGLVFVGLLLFAHTQGVLRFRDSWPLFLVAAGAGIAAETFRSRNSDGATGATHGE